ncbi:MAG: Trp repressor binding protein [Parcubacteria group bacterium Gr01-1014_30]|nr:MAG: Trp repressor binding protein [Parcubacteria group bacterium Gr01-1014_30]
MDTGKQKILIVFYSLGGSLAKVAKEIAKGAKEVEGTEVEIKRVKELVADEVFEKNPRMKRDKEMLEKEFEEAAVEDLIEADGVAIGTPVHFGSFASQIKQYLDQLSPVWLEGKLVNKPVSVFCASGSLHGGEEVALFSLLSPLINFGMIPVGIPYPIQGEGPEFDAGSPFGVVYVTGHGKNRKEFSESDKKVARILGNRLATMTKIIKCGCDSCKVCRSMAQLPSSASAKRGAH